MRSRWKSTAGPQKISPNSPRPKLRASPMKPIARYRFEALLQMNGPPLDAWALWGLQCSQNGIPLANLSNAVSILDNDPALKNLFHYDEFLQRVMHTTEAHEWSDQDDLGLVIHIQRE